MIIGDNDVIKALVILKGTLFFRYYMIHLSLSYWIISFYKVRDMHAHLSSKEYNDWPVEAI